MQWRTYSSGHICVLSGLAFEWKQVVSCFSNVNHVVEHSLASREEPRRVDNL